MYQAALVASTQPATTPLRRFLPNPAFEWPDNAVSSKAAALLLGANPRRLVAIPPSRAPAAAPPAPAVVADASDSPSHSEGPKPAVALTPAARAVQRAAPQLLTPSAIASATPQPSGSPLVIAPHVELPAAVATEPAPLLGASDDVFTLPLFSPGDSSSGQGQASGPGLFTGVLSLGVGGNSSSGSTSGGGLNLPTAGFGLLPSLTALPPLDTASAAADVSDQLGIEWPQPLALELEPLLPAAVAAPLPPVPAATPAELEQELWARALGFAAGAAIGSPSASGQHSHFHHAHRVMAGLSALAASPLVTTGATLPPAAEGSTVSEFARRALPAAASIAPARPTPSAPEQQLSMPPAVLPSGLLAQSPYLVQPPALKPIAAVAAASAPPAATAAPLFSAERASAAGQYDDISSADGDPESAGDEDDEDADIDDLLADVFSFAVGT